MKSLRVSWDKIMQAYQYLCDLDNHGTRWDIQQHAVAVRVSCQTREYILKVESKQEVDCTPSTNK